MRIRLTFRLGRAQSMRNTFSINIYAMGRFFSCTSHCQFRFNCISCISSFPGCELFLPLVCFVRFKFFKLSPVSCISELNVASVSDNIYVMGRFFSYTSPRQLLSNCGSRFESYKLSPVSCTSEWSVASVSRQHLCYGSFFSCTSLCQFRSI